MRITVNTPAGHIGRVVVEQLLAANETVVIISRHPAKVADLVARGAQLVEGSIDDPSVLDRALHGQDALFWLTPFVARADYMEWAPRAANLSAAAVRKNGVQRVVLISSVGAQRESGLGPVGVLPAIERAFREAAPDITALRAGHFMENYLNYAEMIAATGVIFSPYPAARPLPIVATRDIGRKAADALRDPAWKGFRTLGVHGPEDLDQTTAARLIGLGIGRPVKYVEIGVAEAKQGMLDNGVPAEMVTLLADMYTGLRAGLMERAEPRTAETTTPTTLLEFSREVLKPAVDAAARRGSNV